MVTLDTDKKSMIIEGLVMAREWEALVTILKKKPVIEVVEIIRELPTEDLDEVLSYFTPEEQGYIVEDFDMEAQMGLFERLGPKGFARIFVQMASDTRADFYQELDREDQLRLLPYLDKKTRENVVRLSAYEPETAGGIMSTDFATIIGDMTVAQAIQKVRSDAPSRKMIYYVYVVDEDMKLHGFTTLKDLIMAEPDTSIWEIVYKDFVYAEVDEDRESVAVKIEKYDLVAIPVINKYGQLAGIVLHDDAMEVIQAEQTEDMEKFMGIVPDVDGLNYTETTVWGHFRKRIGWVASLAIIGLISGMIIHKYEEAMSALIILALYMPMVADSGGNVGSQAATVVIRAIALGEITVKNWFSILFKEARIAILLSVVLGLIAFGKILFLSWETDVPAQFNLLFIALGISLALSLQVISATMIGAALPLLVKRLGGDPAVAASPAITTIVDITGLLIYFGIAMLMFF
ncbi:MAG: magnesium transporter [Bacteroidales bacterium]|nr:magnesium transporter [Bacteroidales bacterium]